MRTCPFALPALVGLTLSVGGCQQGIAWFVAQFQPPKEYKAEYRLPPGKKVLVFVDDFRRPVGHPPIKEKLTDQINKLLVEHKVAAETMLYDKLDDLAHSERDFNRMPIPNVGRRLGADLVVYVEIRKFSLKENEQSPLWQGQMDVNVKVVDSAAGLLWPPKDQPGGYPVTYADSKPSEDLSPTYGQVVCDRMAEKLGRKIARLFYDHKVPVNLFGEPME